MRAATQQWYFNLKIYSQSVLAEDARYGANRGDASTFRQWREATFQRNLVKQNK